MYQVDITADLNDEDETGFVWTFLDEARDPGQITPGVLVVATTRKPQPCARWSISCPQATARSSISGSCPAWWTSIVRWSSERSPAEPEHPGDSAASRKRSRQVPSLLDRKV